MTEKSEKKETKESKKITGEATKTKKTVKKKQEKAKKEILRPLAKTDYDPMTVLYYVHMAEKSVRAIETHNQLVFIVCRNANKKKIRDAIETAFKEHVVAVRTTIDQKGRKKAFIRFAKEGVAGEIAIKLGII